MRWKLRLSQVSEHAYWYFESGHEPDEEALAGAVRTFEDNIYPVVTSHFGGERGPGIDNDPRITILHVLNIRAAWLLQRRQRVPRCDIPL